MVQSAYLSPLSEYLKARDLFHDRKGEAAAGILERVFGSDRPNTFLRGNIGAVLDHTTPAGQVLLDGIYGEMKCLQRKMASPRKR
jgi:hypothetical protein